ncbi:Ankyrin Repeat Domain-Containing Protein 36C [Manis pentadactyla]|nr:Ankyrin Repeat Domain-Containing Protein 36C [Manis pentadactyla]
MGRTGLCAGGLVHAGRGCFGIEESAEKKICYVLAIKGILKANFSRTLEKVATNNGFVLQTRFQANILSVSYQVQIHLRLTISWPEKRVSFQLLRVYVS